MKKSLASEKNAESKDHGKYNDDVPLLHQSPVTDAKLPAREFYSCPPVIESSADTSASEVRNLSEDLEERRRGYSRVDRSKEVFIDLND